MVCNLKNLLNFDMSLEDMKGKLIHQEKNIFQLHIPNKQRHWFLQQLGLLCHQGIECMFQDQRRFQPDKKQNKN